MLKHRIDQSEPVTVFDGEAEKAREGFLGRLRRRGQPRLLTVQELGGPEPRPLIAGRFDPSERYQIPRDIFMVAFFDGARRVLK